MADYLASLLDPTDPPDDVWFVAKVAACAILLELAASDGDTAAVETDTITRVMRDRFGIDGDAAQHVLALAESSRDAGDAADGYARFVRELWTPDDRKLVLSAVREVIWADGELDPGEEQLVWRLAAMLGLPFDEVRGVLAAGA